MARPTRRVRMRQGVGMAGNSKAGNVVIRLATTSDADAIVDMGAKFFAETSYAGHADYCPESARFLVDMMMSGVLVVADRDGALVGMFGMVVTPFLFNSAVSAAHEVMWWVDPAAVGVGVGGQLLSAGEVVARERGAKLMQMMHLPNSPPAAVALLERRGFALTEVNYSKAL